MWGRALLRACPERSRRVRAGQSPAGSEPSTFPGACASGAASRARVPAPIQPIPARERIGRRNSQLRSHHHARRRQQNPPADTPAPPAPRRAPSRPPETEASPTRLPPQSAPAPPQASLLQHSLQPQQAATAFADAPPSPPCTGNRFSMSTTTRPWAFSACIAFSTMR